MAKPLSLDSAQEALDAVTREGDQVKAALKLGIPRSTLQDRLDAATRLKLRPNAAIENLNDIAHVKARLRRVEKDLVEAEKEALDHRTIKRQIIGLAQDVASATPPKWTVPGDKMLGSPGVPTLFLSDLHWSEVVHPSQINGVNRYNLEIARKRLRFCAERAVRLLKIISPTMDYPGIVVPLGGDMISGNIHDELTATNEVNSMPSVLDLFGSLAWLISYLADEFGQVFLPCVTGNHGRDTMKIWGKDRHHTSFDWLLYCFLAKHFENDKRVHFFIPDGPDAYFKICNHRYLLTHGDQFRGGDGMIGALGPIIRGDHKKRSRNAQIAMEYDTMLLGHWHQYIHLTRLIVNGSLKGYDEYAYSNNFSFELPQQALWITHPQYGITFRAPVFVDHARKMPKCDWVSVAA